MIASPLNSIREERLNDSSGWLAEPKQKSMKTGDAVQTGECGHIRAMDALSLNNKRLERLTWFWRRQTAGFVWRHCNAPMKYVAFGIAERSVVVGYCILSAGIEVFHGLGIRGSSPGVLSPRDQSSSDHAKSQNYDQAIHDWFPCALCVSRSDLHPNLSRGFPLSPSISDC